MIILSVLKLALEPMKAPGVEAPPGAAQPPLEPLPVGVAPQPEPPAMEPEAPGFYGIGKKPKAPGPATPETEIDVIAREYAKAKDKMAKDDAWSKLMATQVKSEVSSRVEATLRSNHKAAKNLGLLKVLKRYPEEFKEACEDIAAGLIAEALSALEAQGGRFSDVLSITVGKYLKKAEWFDEEEGTNERQRFPMHFGRLINLLRLPEDQLVEGATRYERVLETYKRNAWGSDYATKIPAAIDWWNEKHKALMRALEPALQDSQVPQINFDRSQGKVLLPSKASHDFDAMSEKLEAAFNAAGEDSPRGLWMRALLGKIGAKREDMMEAGGAHYLAKEMVLQPTIDDVIKVNDWAHGRSGDFSLSGSGKEAPSGMEIRPELAEQHRDKPAGEATKLEKPTDPMRTLGYSLAPTSMGLEHYKEALSGIFGPGVTEAYIYEDLGRKMAEKLGLGAHADELMDIVFYTPAADARMVKKEIVNKIAEVFPGTSAEAAYAALSPIDWGRMLTLRQEMKPAVGDRQFKEFISEIKRNKPAFSKKIQTLRTRWEQAQPGLAEVVWSRQSEQQNAEAPKYRRKVEKQRAILGEIANKFQDPVEKDIALAIAGLDVPGVGHGFDPLLTKIVPKGSPMYQANYDAAKHNESVIQALFEAHKEQLLPAKRDVAKYEERGYHELATKINKVMSEILRTFADDEEYGQLKQKFGLTEAMRSSIRREVRASRIILVAATLWRRPDFKQVEEALTDIFGFGKSLRKFVARRILSGPRGGNWIEKIMREASEDPDFSREFEVKRGSPASFMRMVQEVQQELMESAPTELRQRMGALGDA